MESTTTKAWPEVEVPPRKRRHAATALITAATLLTAFSAGIWLGRESMRFSDFAEYRVLQAEASSLREQVETLGQDVVALDDANKGLTAELAAARASKQELSGELEGLATQLGDIEAREESLATREASVGQLEAAVAAREADAARREAAADTAGYVDRDGVWWPSAREWSMETCGTGLPDLCTPDEEQRFRSAGYMDVIRELSGLE